MTVDDASKSTVLEKSLGAGGIALVSGVFGYLPILLSKKLDFSLTESTDPFMIKHQKKLKQNVILSALLNLGGGVLLANCFLHWLPETREGFEKADFVGLLPFAELIMCGGFFFICAAEELIHGLVHQKGPKKTNRKIRSSTDSETEFSRYDSVRHGSDKGPRPCTGQEEGECTPLDTDLKSAAQLKSAVRTFFIISALSFHSVIEGLALSLEETKIGIWMVTGATALHKFVIAFSLGIELIANKATTLQYSISIMTFSLAPALGAGIGIILTEVAGEDSVPDLALEILQGVATGTVVYVIFMEIFPKAKSIGGTGLQHITAMIVGFAVFLPSLYWHNSQEHEEEEGGENLFH